MRAVFYWRDFLRQRFYRDTENVGLQRRHFKPTIFRRGGFFAIPVIVSYEGSDRLRSSRGRVQPAAFQTTGGVT
ncbi:MAG: hypothetical protein WA252_18855 [Candidatus Sulfotelmatobacter sp.]